MATYIAIAPLNRQKIQLNVFNPKVKLPNGHATLQCSLDSGNYTETAVCYFLVNLKCLLDQSGFIAAVFLDLKHAFDAFIHTIPHPPHPGSVGSFFCLTWHQNYQD